MPFQIGARLRQQRLQDAPRRLLVQAMLGGSGACAERLFQKGNTDAFTDH